MQMIGVDISVTVCSCVRVFLRLRISPPRIKLMVSNVAQWFISVQGRGSQIFVNFALPEAQNRTNWPARGPHPHVDITVELRRRKRHARDVHFMWM